MKRTQSYLSFLLFSLIVTLLIVYFSNNVSLPEIKGANERVVITTEALVTVTPERLEEGIVKKVIDGDTIELQSGEKVRYIGIDTPETKHPNKGVECFGKEAFERNRFLVEGKKIYLQKDVSNTDRYQRLLRYVYLPDSKSATGEALFVNQYMVEKGYAHALTYPPDVRFGALFRELERKAQAEQVGLWEKC